MTGVAELDETITALVQQNAFVLEELAETRDKAIYVGLRNVLQELISRVEGLTTTNLTEIPGKIHKEVLQKSLVAQDRLLKLVERIHSLDIVRGGLLVHRDTTYLSLFWGCTRVSGRVSRAFLSLFRFSMWILLLLVQVKHKRTLYRFLLQK